jgi:hypothetical protein
MMKRVLLAIATAVLASMLPVVTAAANSDATLNFGSELNAAACGGTPIIAVTQTVLNDADSGFGGNAWAFDNYTRQIKVFQLSDGTFCATTHYEGRFTTNAGISPSGNSTVSAGITGSFVGGYRATQFTGTLLAPPAFSTHGNIGTFDYRCDLTFTCPGYLDWLTLYFSTTSGFNLDWWGWIYHGGQNGTWVNASIGSTGDITG